MHQEGDYVWTTAGTVMAGTEKRIPPGGCSLETTKGLHGAQEQGEAVPGARLPGLPPGPWPIVTSATGTYDGAGNMSGTYTLSLGGTVMSGEFAGKHFVNPNCTFTDEFSPLPGLKVHHAGTIVGEGPFLEELYIYSDPGTVIVGRAKMQR